MIDATQLVVADEEDGFCPVGSTGSLALAVEGESLHKVLVREGIMFGLAKLVPLTPGVPPPDSEPVEGTDRSVRMRGMRIPGMSPSSE